MNDTRPSPLSIAVERPDRDGPPTLTVPDLLLTQNAARPAGRNLDIELPGARAELPARAVAVTPAAPRRPATDILRREVARGLRYTHFRANLNTTQLIQIGALAQATRDALKERRLLDGDDIDGRCAAAADRLAKEYSSRGMGVTFSSADSDKYEYESGVHIDCENRIALCKAACCKLRFALSHQDVEEGVVRWEFGNPYVIAQGADSYCVHLDRQAQCCSIYDARPVTCRAYDCRNDRRIWIDFDKRIVNPDLDAPNWPSQATEAAAAAGETQNSVVPAVEDRAGLLQKLADRPVIIRFRGWIVSSYGLFVGLGFGFAVLLWFSLIALRFQRALPPLSFLAGLPIAAFAGSRLMIGVEHWLAGRLGQQTIAAGGQSFSGGLIASLLYATAFFARDPGGLLFFADCAAPALALAYGIAKLGCFGSGCCIGCPTRSRFAVRYTAQASKAVGFYGLRGVALVPLQLYECAMALALALLLTALPGAAFGTGRAMGLLLVAVSVGRMTLLHFRFRFADDRAAPLLAGLLQVSVAIAGALLAFSGLALPATSAAVAHPPGVISLIFAAVATGSLAMALFGIHRTASVNGSEH